MTLRKPEEVASGLNEAVYSIGYGVQQDDRAKVIRARDLEVARHVLEEKDNGN